MSFTTIEIEQQGSVATVWLNRPEIRNAINITLIRELAIAFKQLGNDATIRVILLKGRGKSFCAGADLNWMRNAATYTYEENLAESRELATCFNTLYNCPKATIAVAHGGVMGGGNGLLAACDLAYCTDDTSFSLSEVKLGLIPATISPYILRRCGEYVTKDLMLTGRKFDGKEAAVLKLVNASVSPESLEGLVHQTIAALLTSGPQAVTACKKLIHAVIHETRPEDIIDFTAQQIADTRTGAEAQEGMSAFLEKRTPNWIE